MKLSAKAMAWTMAVLWGGCVFLAGILNLIFPSYAVSFPATATCRASGA
jgi:hypothetical protein